MHSKLFVIGSLLLLLYIGSIICGPIEESKKACIKSSRAVLKIILKNQSPCYYSTVKEIKDLDEQKKKLGCVTKCVLKAEGVLTEDFMATEESLQAALEGNPNVKLEYKERFYATYLSCKDSFGDKMDPKDPFCKGYSEMGECIQNSIMDICHQDIPL